MAATLTLENVPDNVYTQLRRSAEVHRRSINSEAIAWLENMLLPNHPVATDQLASIRALRESLGDLTFSPDTIDQFKQQGRA